MSTPYRDAQAIPRFLCIVCYRSLSAYAGDCPTCGVPRHDLTDPAVRAEVLAGMERRLQRRMTREYAVLSASTAVLLLPALMVGSGFAALLLAPPVVFGLSRLYAAIRPKSGIAFDLARASAKRALLAGKQPRLDRIAVYAALDPARLDMAELLQWLGAELDDPSPKSLPKP
jgi:hypothetical protein